MPGRSPVDPPQPVVARTGLIGAAGITDDPVERWQLGITYRPHRYLSGGSYDPTACAAQSLTVTAHPPIVEWDAYAIWHGEVCEVARPAALGELRQDAINMLEVQSSHKVERVLWTGKADGAALFPPNVGLASAVIDSGATVVGTGLGVVPGFTALINALNDCLGGARGMIHVPSEALPFLDFFQLVTRQGTQLVGRSVDHLIVAGSGYTGSGPGDIAPAAGFTWFYATTPVQVRLGPTQSGGDWDQLDRATNELVVRAWRPALASWDRQCHLAVNVCLEDPGPLCAGS